MHLVKHSVNTFSRKEFLKITVFSLLFFSFVLYKTVEIRV